MDIEKARKIFAKIVAYEYSDIHDDAAWELSAGIGDVEDLWENYCYWFEEVFGISWEEASLQK